MRGESARAVPDVGKSLDFQSGSLPQVVVSARRAWSLNAETGRPDCGSVRPRTTPSNSPTPEENQGRSRYTRSPFPARVLWNDDAPGAAGLFQPNVGIA